MLSSDHNVREASASGASAAQKHGTKPTCYATVIHHATELPIVQRNFLMNEDGGVGYKPDAGALLDHILGTLSTTEASEMDGKMSNALRMILFGDSFQEDLCARNIFRGREMAMPSYAGIATCFGTTPDATVRCTPIVFLISAVLLSCGGTPVGSAPHPAATPQPPIHLCARIFTSLRAVLCVMQPAHRALRCIALRDL